MNLEELEALQHELNTQDSRITADPIFMVQKQEVQPIPHELIDDGSVMFFDPEDLVQYLPGEPLHDVMMGHWEEECRPFSFVAHIHDPETEESSRYVLWASGFKKEWVNVQTCLTEKAAQEYIDRNGHNLQKDGCEPPRIFVEGLYRNREMIAVRNHFKDGDAVRHAKAAKVLAGYKEVAERMYHLARHGDYKNGVTDECGTSDEGEWMAGREIEWARLRLAELEAEHG